MGARAAVPPAVACGAAPLVTARGRAASMGVRGGNPYTALMAWSSTPCYYEGKLVSYAGYGEDVVLRRFFGEQATGFYVDVGAHDPIVGSVTLGDHYVTFDDARAGPGRNGRRSGQSSATSREYSRDSRASVPARLRSQRRWRRRSEMTRKLVHAVVLMILVAAWTMPCFAEETPGTLWVTAKCALCHGEDGRGNTPSGKQMNVRDLRAEEIQ